VRIAVVDQDPWDRWQGRALISVTWTYWWTMTKRNWPLPTDWDECASLDLEPIHREMRCPVVIDGRNLYDPESMAGLGFTYSSVGRPAVTPEVCPSPTNPPPPGVENS